MCHILIESIEAVFILSLLSINYQQHERLRVEVRRFDSSAVGVEGDGSSDVLATWLDSLCRRIKAYEMSSHAASITRNRPVLVRPRRTLTPLGVLLAHFAPLKVRKTL